jgi:hypothetical protein
MRTYFPGALHEVRSTAHFALVPKAREQARRRLREWETKNGFEVGNSF